MQIAALILAAGRGTRAGGLIPKQLRKLAGKRIIDHALSAFQHHPLVTRIVVVLHPADDVQLGTYVETTWGGATRQLSVLNGLNFLSKNPPDMVLIHDVARATVPIKVISNVIEALHKQDGAAPALPVTDALWKGHNGIVQEPTLRDNLYRAQTPQGFHFKSILAAHQIASRDAQDDVEVALRAGLNIAIVDGCETNIKITRPEDFERVEKIIKDRYDGC